MTVAALDREFARAVVDAIRDDAELRDELRALLGANANVGEERRRWLTLGEAGERLGCSADAIRMQCRRGRLVSRLLGRRLYVSVDRLA